MREDRVATAPDSSPDRRRALPRPFALLAFITSFDEVVIAIFVSGARAPTLPKQMWDGIRTEIDPTVAAVSTLLIGVTTAVIGAITLVRRRAGEDGP